ncbi:hypothetical protein, partial [Acinetobacter sp.]|uniref:hypothetical protein n=1 Tax=Acinetobacter sp. TaxID=472 RepID=UPI0028A582D5
RPFTAVTGVRIPVGTPYSRWQHLNKKPEHCDSGFFILQILFLESLNPVFIICSNYSLTLSAAIPFLILQFVLF